MAVNTATGVPNKLVAVTKLLAQWGYPVGLRSGFRTNQARKDIKFDPDLVTVHHTGGNSTSDSMLFSTGNGVVDGPLCHYTIYRDSKGGLATVVLGAVGYANHAGINDKGAVSKVASGTYLTEEIKPGKDDAGYSANRRAIGIETKAAGAYTDAQYKSCVALCAAIAITFKMSEKNPPIGGHKEFTSRKNDPVFGMAKFRRDVVAFIKEKTGDETPATPATPATPEAPKIPGTAAPKFPLPDGYYFGPKEGPENSFSGYQDKRFGKKLGTTWLKDWQAEAKTKGFYTGEADGLYGDMTKAAARAVQKAAKLDVDGLVGPLTWAAAWTLSA